MRGKYIKWLPILRALIPKCTATHIFKLRAWHGLQQPPLTLLSLLLKTALALYEDCYHDCVEAFYVYDIRGFQAEMGLHG